MTSKDPLPTFKWEQVNPGLADFHLLQHIVDPALIGIGEGHVRRRRGLVVDLRGEAAEVVGAGERGLEVEQRVAIVRRRAAA